MQALAIIPYTLTEKFMSDQETLPCLSEFSSLQTHKEKETRFLQKFRVYIYLIFIVKNKTLLKYFIDIQNTFWTRFYHVA